MSQEMALFANSCAATALPQLSAKPAVVGVTASGARMTHSCPWSDAAACDHSHPPGELAAKTRKQVTAHASFSLNNFIALVRRIL